MRTTIISPVPAPLATPIPTDASAAPRVGVWVAEPSRPTASPITCPACLVKGGSEAHTFKVGCVCYALPTATTPVTGDDADRLIESLAAVAPPEEIDRRVAAGRAFIEAVTPAPTDRIDTRCPSRWIGKACTVPAPHSGQHEADGGATVWTDEAAARRPETAPLPTEAIGCLTTGARVIGVEIEPRWAGAAQRRPAPAPPPSLADQVRAARASLGVSQVQFAARVGCATSTIADVERGERVSVDVLRRIAGAAGASFAFAIAGDTDVGRPRAATAPTPSQDAAPPAVAPSGGVDRLALARALVAAAGAYAAADDDDAKEARALAAYDHARAAYRSANPSGSLAAARADIRAATA